jgi:hypothetical protein
MDGGQGGGDINARINAAGGDGSRSALLSLLVALMEESHASVLSLVSRTTPPASGGAVDMTVGLLDESLHLHGRLDKITAQLVRRVCVQSCHLFWDSVNRLFHVCRRSIHAIHGCVATPIVLLSA